MPYGKRLDWPGALHHVMSRGINGLKIFGNEYQKNKMLGMLDRYIEGTGITIHAWAIMDNHFHMLLETGKVPLSSVMHRLLTAYAVWYNRSLSRVGRVFQGRYRSILVEKEKYYNVLIAYIYMNPLRAGCVKETEELVRYRYCGHIYTGVSDRRCVHEFSASSDEKMMKKINDEIDKLQKGLKSGVSEVELERGNCTLSFSGVNAGIPAPPVSLTWKGNPRILGNKAFIADAIQKIAEKRLIPERNRGEQHRKAMEALSKIARDSGITQEMILGRARYRELFAVRARFVRHLVTGLGFSFSDVARFLHRSRQSVRYMFFSA